MRRFAKWEIRKLVLDELGWKPPRKRTARKPGPKRGTFHGPRGVDDMTVAAIISLLEGKEHNKRAIATMCGVTYEQVRTVERKLQGNTRIRRQAA